MRSPGIVMSSLPRASGSSIGDSSRVEIFPETRPADLLLKVAIARLNKSGDVDAPLRVGAGPAQIRRPATLEQLGLIASGSSLFQFQNKESPRLPLF